MNKGFALGDNSSQSKQSNIDAVKKSRQQEKSPAPKGVGAFFKGVGTALVSLLVYVTAAAAIMYAAAKHNNELSLPTNQSQAPYTSIPQKGTSDVGKTAYAYEFTYGWPYDEIETEDSGNFISNWFAKMMITSWSSSRGILHEVLRLFNMITKTSEVLMITLAPFLFLLTWIFSGFVGFLATAYGSLQDDIWGMMTTFFAFIFCVLFFICSFTGFLQSAMLFMFFMLIPFLYQSGRQYIGGVFKRNSKFIGLLFALAVTLNAYKTLDHYVALGMLIGFGLIFLKAYLF